MTRLSILLALSCTLAACTVAVDDIPPGARFSCTADADCPTGKHCAANLCVSGSVKDGDSCSQPGDCVSGACIEGICCHQACAAQDPSTCGQTGHCVKTGANAGQCELFAAGTSCAPATCSAGQYRPPQSCDGSGAACPAPAPVACPNGLDCQDGQTCRGGCTAGTTTGCTGGAWCRTQGSGTACVVGQQQNGDPCAAGTDCTSGHCNSGFCCSSGTCCATGNTATCPAVTDVCDTPATCHGTHTDYACVSNVCTAQVSQNDALCNGQTANTCGTLKDAVCGASTTCAPTCAPGNIPDDSLCDANAYCGYSGGYQCLLRVADGASCTANDQCTSNYCDTAAGICCGGTTGTHCCNPGTAETNCAALTYAARTCDTPGTCTGTRPAATCTANVCGTSASTRLSDDSACTSSTGYIACPANFAIYCSGASDQGYLRAATCPTTCGYACHPNGSGGQICLCTTGASNACAPSKTCTQNGGTAANGCAGSTCG